MALSQKNNRRRLLRACANAWLGLRRLLAPPTYGRWPACAMLLSAVFLSAPASAQVSKEYQLKAVFLWRLAQFTVWPSDAFENTESPIVICVLGDNPFDGALTAAVSGETAHGRKFVVQLLRVIEQAKTCHILYTTSGAARQGKEIATALAGKSVLTVRDGTAPASSFETMIVFISEQNKIRMRINLKAAVAARLVLDPRLLRAAEVIGE